MVVGRGSQGAGGLDIKSQPDRVSVSRIASLKEVLRNTSKR